MHDIKWIRENPDLFDALLARRGHIAIAQDIIELDATRREAQREIDESLASRNEISRQIHDALKSKGFIPDDLTARVKDIKTQVAELELVLADYKEDIEKVLLGIPNLPLEEVAVGRDEADNTVYPRPVDWIPPQRNFGFTPVEHFDIPSVKKLFGFDTAAKISGSRFSMLRGNLARLERALGQFMLDTHVSQHDYEEVQSPLLVKDHALVGTGQLPKFLDDLYVTYTDGDSLTRMGLIPTAEVPLTNIIRDEILSDLTLPLRFTSLTPCFREEAGAAGRDTRGMLRQHQFNKVELVSIVEPARAHEEHERMLECSEKIMQFLGLHYRVMSLCTGDMGFSAQKTYDIEVWLPGQNQYREISSISQCGDFQSRRMNARYRDSEGAVRYPTTLNGSGTAVGRCLVAVLENYQQEDGSVAIPDVLHPYMGGVKVLPLLG